MSRAATRLPTSPWTRALTGLAGVGATLLLTATPTYAEDIVGPLEGHDPGDGLGVAGALLLYVVIPLAVMAVIAALVMLPSMVRGTRYRPARGWAARPVWFAGPVDAEGSISAATPGDVVRGGASGSW